jgi:copper transport protein
MLAVALSALALPTPASAHAFLAQSSPQAGERLRTRPRTLVLQFTEAVAPASNDHVTLRTAAGQPVRIGPLVRVGGGTILTARLPHLGDGVYVVTWQDVSADDGHPAAGEFAFGVGRAAALPTQASSVSAPTNWPEAIAGWLLLLGLALGAGGLASEMLIWRPLTHGQSWMAQSAPAGIAPLARGRSGALPPDPVVSDPPPTTQTWALPQVPPKRALLLAVVGAGGLFVLVASRLNGGGPLAGFDPHAWLTAVQVQVGLLTLAIVVLALYALVALIAARQRGAALVSLLAAAIALALRSHPAATHSWWGTLAIVIHVAVAILWTGMLAHLVLVFWRRHAQPPPQALHAAVWRYARLALWSVLLVLLSGAGAALAELTDVRELLTTTYGRVLLVKGAVVALALLFALVARLRALPQEPVLSLPLLRRLMRGEGVSLAVVLGAAGGAEQRCAAVRDAGPECSGQRSSGGATSARPDRSCGRAGRLAAGLPHREQGATRAGRPRTRRYARTGCASLPLCTDANGARHRPLPPTVRAGLLQHARHLAARHHGAARAGGGAGLDRWCAYVGRAVAAIASQSRAFGPDPHHDAPATGHPGEGAGDQWPRRQRSQRLPLVGGTVHGHRALWQPRARRT